ncbi:MAG: glycosyltransferase family 4 protein [Gammaproteobacteria bacterium]|nr:glycosyltransferase family 4 protein [Gammaproteobacteria bacterium]
MTEVKYEKNKKLLFLFSRQALPKVKRIRDKEIPSEALFGATDLMDKGWEVEISDHRHVGLFGKFNTRFNLINIATILRIYNSDCIIVKSKFSLMTSIVCRLLGKKIIYKDVMYRKPKPWKWVYTYINFKLASSVICYSPYQARGWEKIFKLKSGSIYTMDYCSDVSFYPKQSYKHNKEQYVIAVGRDPGRDYTCLSRAVEKIGISCKLITLPYLLDEEILNNNKIEVLQRIPYDELFHLYSNCLCAVVPLQKELDYPTGIRGVLEATALGVPTVVSRTPVLEEYFTDGKELMFVDPEDVNQLSNAIKSLANDKNLAESLARNASQKSREEYNMAKYTEQFESIILDVIS